MAKVVTSQGIQDFVQSGKFDQVKNDPLKKKADDAPALEVKDKPIVADVSRADDKKDDKKEPKTNDASPEDFDDDDDTRAEMERDDKLRDRIARKNATINRKHREMREAREAAEEAERFAENQYKRATLAEQRADAHERELAELRAKTQAPAVKVEEAKKPDPKAFYDDKGQFKAFEYAEELAAYSANKAVSDDRAKQAEDLRKAEAAAAESLARERVAETTKKHPDFAEVMQASDLKTHTAVLQYLSASEQIGEVSYYLATHPEFVDRINKLHPLKAIAEVRDIEKTFEKPAAKTDDKSDDPLPVKMSGAPAPIKPLSSATTVNTNTDPAKMNYKELRAYERSRNRRRS